MEHFTDYDLNRSSFEEPFMFDDIIMVEKTVNSYSNKNAIYMITSFDKIYDTIEHDFDRFKTLYINQEFRIKIFYTFETGDVTHTVYIYERISKETDIEFIFNKKNKSISIVVDPLSCKTPPNKTFFEIPIASDCISIIDKLNILLEFNLLDSKTAKLFLNKKDYPKLFNYFVKEKTEFYTDIKKNFPRLNIKK